MRPEAASVSCCQPAGSGGRQPSSPVLGESFFVSFALPTAPEDVGAAGADGGASCEGREEHTGARPKSGLHCRCRRSLLEDPCLNHEARADAREDLIGCSAAISSS